MKLDAKYFVLSEFLVSGTADRLGLKNVPTPKHLANLQALVTNTLDPFRARIGRPIFISSGYRSPALNAAVGGVASSQHSTGQAADFNVPGMSAPEVVEALRSSGLPFDQLINEFNSWVHVSHHPLNNKREVLKATRIHGRVKYTRI